MTPSKQRALAVEAKARARTPKLIVKAESKTPDQDHPYAIFFKAVPDLVDLIEKMADPTKPILTPSKARALAAAAKAKRLEAKGEENKRAYQRRKERERLKELHRLSGVETYLTRTAEETKTPKFLHGIHLAKRGRRLDKVTQNLPCANTFIPIREYYDTPEDRADVARILAKK